MDGDARQRHWDDRYVTVGAESVSWYQPDPAMSVSMLDRTGLGPHAAVVDVGAGASLLVDRLVADGWDHVTVLDVSAEALDLARARLPEGSPVTWVRTDLLEWRPERRYDLWHDRAVFHFLVEGDDRERYRAVLRAALRPGGCAVLATFAEDGPTMCSGLPVQRYAHPELLAALGPGFEGVATAREVHRTPAGGEQSFTWLVARRTG